jgi:3,4-dihydroxy 2-butanone 4-phosphate synthase/GTP cyclohydrolase II
MSREPFLRVIDLDGTIRHPVEVAVNALRSGGMCVVIDDEDRENEADLVVAAEDITADQIAFMVRHTTGILCAPMLEADLGRLELPLMVSANDEPHGTAFTVSVDAVGTGTGVSASDRSATFHALSDPATTASMLRRPGHVFPLRYREGGVLKRAGHTEASMDLITLAGKRPIAVISEIVRDDGAMASGPDLLAFAREHSLPVVRIDELVRYRRTSEALIRRSGRARLPVASATFDAVAYTEVGSDVEHFALVLGDVTGYSNPADPPLVRVHSECLTGDVFDSLRCDCGSQLREAIGLIEREGRGVIVYLRGQEGRGIGLGHKLRAYALQDTGRDTVDANLDLGMPVDSREYGIGAQILSDIGVRRLRLITNNPDKYTGLSGFDLEIVGRITLPSTVNEHNRLYLRTKRDRLGHTLDLGHDGDSGVRQEPAT